MHTCIVGFFVGCWQICNKMLNLPGILCSSLHQVCSVNVLATYVLNSVHNGRPPYCKMHTAFVVYIILCTLVFRLCPETRLKFFDAFAAPESAPVVMPATATSSTSIRVEWSSPHVPDHQLPILSYTVSYQLVGRSADPNNMTVNAVDGVTHRINITGLEAYKQYVITVYSNNREGPSPPSNQVIVRTLSDSEYRHDSLCLMSPWTID